MLYRRITFKDNFFRFKEKLSFFKECVFSLLIDAASIDTKNNNNNTRHLTSPFCYILEP